MVSNLAIPRFASNANQSNLQSFAKHFCKSDLQSIANSIFCPVADADKYYILAIIPLQCCTWCGRLSKHYHITLPTSETSYLITTLNLVNKFHNTYYLVTITQQCYRTRDRHALKLHFLGRRDNNGTYRSGHLVSGILTVALYCGTRVGSDFKQGKRWEHRE